MSTLFNVIGCIYFLVGIIIGLVKIPAAIRALRRSPLRAVRDGALRVTLFIVGFCVLAALGNTSEYGRKQSINMIWIFATIAVLIYVGSAIARVWRDHKAQDKQTEQRLREQPVPEGIMYAHTQQPSSDPDGAAAPASTSTQAPAVSDAAHDMRQ
ncbi:hypothetical protein [Bifidobacterium criceti]|uniref:Uncharacterized protein n=1 Tax=Bifidobacterium criceti TaxID=1960969 RepID=A0A2A2ED40_9BIFI|nr:hypothetical protein [Bifidobacterium criceti]PAU66877.1 hypothetical protein B1526_1659 [Bifidobacterium criceti]